MAASVFGDLVGEKLAKMDLSFLDLSNLLSSWVTTTQWKKAPDMSWQPTESPKGRSPLWPTFVLEVEYTETEAQLERDARWWLEQSKWTCGHCDYNRHRNGHR